MKQIVKFSRFALLLVAMLTMSVTQVWAGWTDLSESLVITTSSTIKQSSYNGSKAFGDWTIVNGANNNGGWAYFKMGGKSATLSTANPCYIYYSANTGISDQVDSITVHIPSGSLSKTGMSVNSWGVYVYSDKAMTNQVDYVNGGTITNAEGSFGFKPSAGKTWAKNYYYKVSWDLANTTTTNGIIFVDKITLHKQSVAQTTVTLTAGENGSVKAYSDAARQTELSLDANNQFKVNQNTTVYFTATPSSSDYVVDSWTGATADTQDNTKASLEVGTATEKTVSVSFKPSVVTGYSVTLNQTTGGTIAATPKTGLAEGAEVTLSYNLTTGYTFGEWTVLDGSANPVSVTDNKFNMPASDVEVEASFTPIAVTEVQLKSATSIEVGATETLTATVVPSDALVQTLTWASDKPEVATVDQTGKVTAVATGSANITATSNNSKVGTCAVTVTPALPTLTITADQVSDFTTTYKDYTWTVNKISGHLYAYKTNGMQFNTSKSGYYVYNTDAIPGAIRSIKMTTHSSGTEREWNVWVSASPITDEEGDETKLDTKNVAKTGTTWEVTGSNSYFYLEDNNGTSQISEIVIKYEEITSPITFSNPENGTLAIKNGDDAIATGDNIKMGTELTVTATPASGAYRLQAVKVIKTGADPEEDVTDDVYKDGKITMPAYAITVSAVMEANNYDVTFHSNTTPAQDDYTQTFTYTVAQNLTANTFTAPTGYEFYKWATTAEGEGTIADGASYTLASEADADLYAKWNAKTIELVLDGVDDNATDGEGAAEFDGDAIITTNASWEQHELNGYYTASTGGSLVLSSDGTLSASVEGYTDANAKWIKDADEAVTLYAQWTSLAKYNISYDLTGCTANSGNPTEIALDATSVTLNFDLASTNYTWTGALVDVLMGGATLANTEFTFENGQMVITPTNGFKGNIEVIIVCEYAPATLMLSENGAESAFGSDLKVNDQVTLPDCEVECDKTFVGWSESNTEFTNLLAAGASYTLTATSNKLYAVFATETPGDTLWIKTSSVAAGQYIIINNGYYLPNTATSSAPAKETAPTITNDTIKNVDVTDVMKWNISDAGSGKIYIKNANNDFLYEISNNNGIRIGSTSDTWTVESNGVGLAIKGTNNSRYCATYTSDWRSYTTKNASNYGDGGKLYFYQRTIAAPSIGTDYSVTCTAKTAAPEFSLTAGEYTTAQTLTITASEGTIHYTDNGDDPDEDSPVYSSAISLNTWGTKTIKAMAIADGKTASDIVSATYVINLPFASLEELVAADIPSGSTVTVSFSDVEITSFNGTKGVNLNVQKEDEDIQIYNSTAFDTNWKVGGKLSATNLTCSWVRYSQSGTFKCWELTPSDWTGFTYTNPAHITSIVISGEPTKKSYSDGQTLESDGLVVTGYYDDHTEQAPHSEVITEGLTWNLPTLTEDQTSADVTVKYTEPILSAELTSEPYQVTGLSVSAAKVLQSIYVADDSEHETDFFVGRPFSSAGLKVMAKYSIGDDEQITPTSISTPTMTAEGEQTITITYTENEVEKQTSYTITLAYMDLSDLVAATDINDGDYVYVKFTNQQIKSFYTSSSKNKGIYFDIQKDENDIEIYANGTACPSTWEQYGTVSATLNNVQWTKYNDTWELKPSNWDAFTYNAPNVPVTSMTIDPAAVSVGETKTTQLSIVYTPTYATNKGVTWAVTEGADKASVDENGLVTGLKEGSATVTATLTADPTITATCAITVTATAKCTISYVVKGEEASTQTIVRAEAGTLTYVPAAVSGHTFVGWAESDVATETSTPVTVITEYTPGAEEANKTLYAVYKYEDTSVEGYGNYNKITDAPADWSGKYLFVSETGNCAVKGSAIAAGSLSHTAVTITDGVIAADDALLPEVLEVKKGTTNYTIKGGNGMYFTYNGTENGFSAATTGAIEYPITYDNTNKKTVITCPTSGGIPFQVNEQTSGTSKTYTFRFYKSAQKAVQLYKLVEGTFYYTSYPSVKYTVTFNADGGTGACAKIVVNAGESATICEDVPTKELNKFNNWSDGTNNYAPGATIENINADINLTAQWTAKVQYTITFDKNGAEGTAPEAITDYEGNQVTLPTKGNMSYTDFTFKGWNDGETTYAGGAKFTMPETNVTMTAVWQDATETHWALVINEKQLKEGDKVIIVAANYEKALAAQYDTKYRNVVDVTKSEDTYYVTESDDAPTTLTVGVADSKITFHDGNGYLYASSTSSNEMNVQEVLDDNGKWDVTILNGVATIKSVGNESKPFMQYNTSSPRVACYGEAQPARALAIYKYYETKPEYVERAMPTMLATNCIAKGGVEEYSFSGATFYDILDKDAAGSNVTFQEATTLVAGMPYIIEPVAGANKVLMMVGGDEATAQNNNGLYGWLSDDFGFDSQIDSKDVYFVSGGKIKRCGNNCTIKTNRAYIVLSEIGGEEQSQPLPGRRKLTLGVEGAQTPTGIDALTEEMTAGDVKKVVVNGQLFILRDGKMYDAQGQLVQTY